MAYHITVFQIIMSCEDCQEERVFWRGRSDQVLAFKVLHEGHNAHANKLGVDGMTVEAYLKSLHDMAREEARPKKILIPLSREYLRGQSSNNSECDY